MINTYNNFLATALKGDFSIDSEDRLTQIFTACFNCSPSIKKAALKYLLGISPRNVSEYEIKSQIQTNDKGKRTDSRPDMILYKKSSPVAVIESKIEAILEEDQLIRHYQNFKKYKRIKFISLTQQTSSERIRCWVQKFWFEMAEIIESIVSERGIDSFIHMQMVNYFKEHKIMKVLKISYKDLKNASDCIDAIQNFKGRIDTEALNKMNEFIKVILEKIKANDWIKSRLAQTPQQTSTSSFWFYDNKDHKTVSIGKDLYITNRKKKYRFSINFFQKLDVEGKEAPSRLSIALWDDSSYFSEIAVWAVKEKDIVFKSINTRKTKLQEISADRVCEIAKDSLRKYLSAKDPKEVDVLNL